MTTQAPAFGDYLVFMDESGDHGLETIDAEFPLFVLVFTIIEKTVYTSTVLPTLKNFKFRFWGHDAVILHSRDIRKPNGDFAFLMLKEQRDVFMPALNEIMETIPVTLIATAIRKEPLTQRYKKPFNPYHIALALGIERLNAFLLDHGQEGRLTHLLAEGRGEKEDKDLELEFRRIMDGKGMLGSSADGTPLEMRFLSKKANAEGMQLADLFAHPIGRHILKPDQPNRAFDITKPKLMADKRQGIEGWGLKVFP